MRRAVRSLGTLFALRSLFGIAIRKYHIIFGHGHLTILGLWFFTANPLHGTYGVVVICKQCASEGVKNFNGEVAIHFPGLDGLNKPIVWVFPKMFVCSKCGFAEFTVPERELSVLVQGKVVPGAVVSVSKTGPKGR